MKKLSTSERSNLKNIVILALGGEIAGVGKKNSTLYYDSGALSIECIIKSVPCLDEVANITAIQISNVSGNDITYEDWKKLVSTINKLSKSPDVDGFVVTTGTDTLEETAFFINLTIKTVKPVVVTGAFRPSTALSPDGPINLYQSVVLASNEQAVDQGVLVCVNSNIITARDVQKISTFQVQGMSENMVGSLGFVRDDNVYFFDRTTRPYTVESVFDITNVYSLPKVGIAYFAVEADANILNFLASNNDGIIIASAGDGGMSTSWINTIECLSSQGVPIIISTRVSNGNVTTPNNASTFNPQKARILLQLALTITNEMDNINYFFSLY